MLPEEKKKLEGFLSKTLKIDTEELASLYNDAGELVDLTVAEKADADRIKKLKGVETDQYKRGIKEGASKIEKAVREKYGVDSELEGVELIDFLVTEKITEVKGTGDDITKHPDFLKHKHDWEKEQKLRDKEWEKKIDAKEAEFTKKAMLPVIDRIALDELKRSRALLPTDQAKAKRWENKYLEEFRGFDYQEKDGDFIMLKEGEAVKDSHGHIITLSDFARETVSSMFDLEVAEARSSSGNKNEPPKTTVKPPKDEQDLFDQMKAAKTPEERIAIKVSYENSKKK